MLEWLDAHAGSAGAVSTVVLVVVTAYYAWTTRALVRETHSTLQGAARATLQERMDRISTLCIQQPNLFPLLDCIVHRCVSVSHPCCVEGHFSDTWQRGGVTMSENEWLGSTVPTCGQRPP